MGTAVVNIVSVSGNANEIKRFRKTVEGVREPFDLNKIIPMPKELEGTTKLYGFDELLEALKGNWKLSSYKNFTEGDIERARRYYSNLLHFGVTNSWEWRAKHWNIEYDVQDCLLEDETETSLKYIFVTVYRAPSPIFEEIKKRFPFLSIQVDISRECEDLALGDPEDVFCVYRSFWKRMETKALSEEEVRNNIQRSWNYSDYYTVE